MARQATPKDLSLRWLDLFQICARKGSVQEAAKETGLSPSTVSHHIRSLEDHLGVALFDHGRRPMILTPKGEAFLRNIDGALVSLRRATAEASSGDVAEAGHLRIGTIEDFDSDIIPELAVSLSRNMPRCQFLYHTDSSHRVLDMLRDRHLDLGITVTGGARLKDLQMRALLRDPFVVVLPRDSDLTPEDVVGGGTDLPFLRFSNPLIIARQIEGQLRRMGYGLSHGFACSNNQTLMAMVAAGAGWTITTPLLFSRAREFHGGVAMHPFPGKSFARDLALVASPDCAASVMDLVEGRMRALIGGRAVAPMVDLAPWLEGRFALIGSV